VNQWLGYGPKSKESFRREQRKPEASRSHQLKVSSFPPAKVAGLTNLRLKESLNFIVTMLSPSFGLDFFAACIAAKLAVEQRVAIAATEKN
jgi:hypothetical protein